LNINHLLSKLDELKMLVYGSNNIDLIGICETFLDHEVDNETISVPNFSIERKDRDCANISKTSGGGIVLYIANHLHYTRRFDLETDDVECLWVEVRIKSIKPILVCSVYRPPWATVSWSESFERQIETASLCNLEMYILGDFNINYCTDTDSVNNQAWAQCIRNHDLCQLIKNHTRVTKSSASIIDHLYARHCDSNFVVECFVAPVAISDHYPICFTKQ
jgi:hypothetical protein